MRLLLDTHTLFWWLKNDPLLSDRAREAIGDEDATVFVSAASAWEIAIKFRIGKWPEAEELARDLHAIIIRERFVALPVTISHALRSGMLAHDHRDPFDRLRLRPMLRALCSSPTMHR